MKPLPALMSEPTENGQEVGGTFAIFDRTVAIGTDQKNMNSNAHWLHPDAHFNRLVLRIPARLFAGFRQSAFYAATFHATRLRTPQVTREISHFQPDVTPDGTRGSENHNKANARRLPSRDQDLGKKGSVVLIGAGPGAKDLLTLRAAARLNTADVILYDRLVDPELLDLARDGAECVYVGKAVGASAWPQERINALIVHEACKGRKVVRLKSGDSGVFGRAGEELAAARDAGFSVEIIPGITAACAAAASAGMTLTQRGSTDTLILATATGAHGGPLEESLRFTGPGTTTAFYMATRQSRTVQQRLLARGLSPSTEITLAIDVSKPSERILTCPLSDLEATVQSRQITGCAIILVTWPRARGDEQIAAYQPTAIITEEMQKTECLA